MARRPARRNCSLGQAKWCRPTMVSSYTFSCGLAASSGQLCASHRGPSLSLCISHWLGLAAPNGPARALCVQPNCGLGRGVCTARRPPQPIIGAVPRASGRRWPRRDNDDDRRRRRRRRHSLSLSLSLHWPLVTVVKFAASPIGAPSTLAQKLSSVRQAGRPARREACKAAAALWRK